MAPVPEPSSLLTSLTNLLRRTPSPSPISPKSLHLASRAQDLIRRDLVDPGAGVIPPTHINNKAFFAFFGLIGVFFILTGIWFFFWAKNGGFYFKETDWDDYKSTVLRRKGPNGTTLSGATASTDLGGGSVVHGEKRGKSIWGRKKVKNGKGGKKGGSVADSRYKDFEEGSSLNGSELSSEMSELKWQTQAAAAALKKSKDKEVNKKKKSRFGGAGRRAPPTVDEEMDIGINPNATSGGIDDDMRAYRHEKPARVGGINKAPDSSAFDGTITNDGSNADLLSNREHTPTNTPTKVRKERKDTYTGGTGGIRKVISTSSPSTKSAGSFWTRATGTSTASEKKQEEERIRSEARKLQDIGRAAQRRDFSFQAGDDASSSGVGGGSEDAERRARREERRARRAKESVPGSYVEGSEVGSDLSGGSGDVGTKSYHHPIPGLSSSDYAEERRRKRNGGGYRRD